MTITTITKKNGQSMKMEKFSFEYLNDCRKIYNIDAHGMADGGMCLTSSFRSYVDFDKLRTFEGATVVPEGWEIDIAENRFRQFNNFFEVDF